MTKFLNTTALAGVALAGAMALGAANANAALMLSLDDNAGSSVIVTDGGMNDSNPNVGLVTYSGTVGATWISNITTGLGYPFPTFDFGHVDLNSVNTSIEAGHLTMILTATDQESVNELIRLENQIGGTLDQGGTLQTSVTVDGVAVPSLTQIFDNISPFSGSEKSDEITLTTGGMPYLYDVALRVDLWHTGGGSTSFNNELQQPVSEAGTLGLFGLGLMGLGMAMRRRKTA